MKGREPYLTMKEAAALSLIYSGNPLMEGLRDLELGADSNFVHLITRLEKAGLIRGINPSSSKRWGRFTSRYSQYSLTKEGLRSLNIWRSLARQVLAVAKNKNPIEADSAAIEAKGRITASRPTPKRLSESVAEEIVAIRSNR